MTARRAARALAVVPALLLAAACVVPPAGSAPPPADGADVQAQLFKLQKDTAALMDRLDAMQKAAAAGGATSACAEAATKADQLQHEVRVLEEQLLAGQKRVDEVLSEVRALRKQAAAVPVPAPAATSPAAPAEPPAAVGDAEAPPPLAGGSASELFNAAYSDFSRRHFELALAGFQAAVKADPRGPVADDAQYWVGETLLAMSRPDDAVAAFDRLIADYPAAEKIPAAHLKKALALLDARRPADAAEEFQLLIRRWPDSDEARIAREHMRRRGMSTGGQ